MIRIGKIRYFRNFLIVMLVGVLAGCGTMQQKQTKRFFWPTPPERPRIEWVSSYRSVEDLKGTSLLTELLASEKPIAVQVPIQIAADDEGRVFVSDQKLAEVVVFDLKKKTVKSVAEDSRQKPVDPSGLALDGEGKLYVADATSATIFVYGKDLRLSEMIPVKDVGFTAIGRMDIDPVRKRLVVPDIRKHRIVILGLDGTLIKTVGKRGNEKVEFNYPNAVTVDASGDILVCDQMNARVQRLSPEGEYKSEFGTRGDGPGEFAVIKGIDTDSEGHIYVTDGKNNKVSIFSPEGKFLLDFGGTYAFDGARVVPGGFLAPQGIFIDKKDAIYVTDSGNERFQKFQYMNDSYLQQHPYRDDEVAREPKDGKKGK